jgi:transposase
MLSLSQSPSPPVVAQAQIAPAPGRNVGGVPPVASTGLNFPATPPLTVKPERFIGLDIHKAYLVAAGVNAEQQFVLPFQRVDWKQFGAWLRRTLTARDAVVVEMTTNTWEVYDALVEHVQSVTVVHPPHVALITRARVMNDKRAALVLAQLHAAGLLVSIWVPPPEIRDLRLLVAQRWKMVKLATIAKTRLHNVLHRHHLEPPTGSQPFHIKHEQFWLGLALSAAEKAAVRCDWQTLQFAKAQQVELEKSINQVALNDPRVPLLLQLPGVGTLIAVTILAAIGPIERFPDASHLVGYAGMGARVHDSGETHRTGSITKAGRRDLRAAMVGAAQHAVKCHPYWKAQYERLEPRKGRNKTLVAVARRLLVGVWHILAHNEVDIHADATQVACSFFKHAYDVGVKNLPDGQSALQFTRNQLDRLGIGADLKVLPWGSKKFKLPQSRLETPETASVSP